MDGCLFVESIRDGNPHRLTLPKPDEWSRNRPVYRDGMTGPTVYRQLDPPNGKRNVVSGEFSSARSHTMRVLSPCRQKAVHGRPTEDDCYSTEQAAAGYECRMRHGGPLGGIIDNTRSPGWSLARG